MSFFGSVSNFVIAAVSGRYCAAIDPDRNATCWRKVDANQPGGICDACWTLLATQGTVEQRCALAHEPDVPPRIADLLIADREDLVRAEMATGALTPSQRLKLAADCDSVTIRLATRNDLSEDDLAIIRRSSNANTRRVLQLD
jgi:hypothetical protein